MRYLTIVLVLATPLAVLGGGYGGGGGGGLTSGDVTPGFLEGTNYAGTVAGDVAEAGTNYANSVFDLTPATNYSDAVAGAVAEAGTNYAASLSTDLTPATNYTDTIAGDVAEAATNYTDSMAGGIALAGSELAIDASDWFGWEAAEGSRIGSNACVAVGWSTANATNNIKSGYAWYSTQEALQDKYMYSRLRIPSYATALTGMTIRVMSTTNDVAQNYIDFLMADGSGNTFLTNNLVGANSNVWTEYYIDEAHIGAMTNLTARPAYSVRADSHVAVTNYINFPEVEALWR